MRGLYIHIPFCKSICSYCDFTKRLGDNLIYEKYIDRLIEEIDSYKDELINIKTVYIGGGTPNVLPLELLERLFIKIKPYLDNSIENSIELNPELITRDLAKLLNKYKFNRVSLGVETIDPEAIKLLNRHHTKQDIYNSFRYLKDNNISNINCDLIFGIPYTDLNTLKNDLDFIIHQEPTHISCYSLIIENKTILKHKIDKGVITPLDDDLISDMYDYINTKLKSYGYNHYEISNYAITNHESIHNKIYWTENEYVGVGAGASGFINNTRYDNNKRLKPYFEAFRENTYELSSLDKKKEFMMLGLRLIKGVSMIDYKRMFNSSMLDDFKDEINKLLKKNLLEIVDNNIRIPYDKLFLANIVWEEFV